MHPLNHRYGINHYHLVAQSYSPKCPPPNSGKYDSTTGMCTRPNGQTYCANYCPCPSDKRLSSWNINPKSCENLNDPNHPILGPGCPQQC